MEKETMQVFEEGEQQEMNQTLGSKADDLKEENQENDSETVPEEPSPSRPEEENAPSQ